MTTNTTNAPQPKVGDRVRFEVRPAYGETYRGEGIVETVQTYTGAAGGVVGWAFVVRDDEGEGHGVIVPPDGMEVVK